MSSAPAYTDDLLHPISPAQPAGVDLRWTVEWDRIKEARRADDGLESGKWAKKERKTADWPLLWEIAGTMLRERSKDLQLALWLTEAGIKLDGFAGLREGLRVTRELLVRYWDSGLFPTMEDGPEDRAGPFEWLNNKLVDSIAAIPVTARGDHDKNFSYIDLQDARRLGSESGFRSADGDVLDEHKQRAFERAVSEGHVSMDMFSRAMKETPRADFERIHADFEGACEEFKALEKVIEEKFGDSAPNLSACRGMLNEMRQAMADLHESKRRDEPDPIVPYGPPAAAAQIGAQPAGQSVPVVLRLPISVGAPGGPAGDGAWRQAEDLIRAGEVDKGLREMTRLAASETTGRSRFQRKLLLAEVCLASRRERLGRLILEELAELIDKMQLENWESSELIAGVWTRLYRLYTQGETADPDRAQKLYERLCRLDPWQALTFPEA